MLDAFASPGKAETGYIKVSHTRHVISYVAGVRAPLEASLLQRAPSFGSRPVADTCQTESTYRKKNRAGLQRPQRLAAPFVCLNR